LQEIQVTDQTRRRLVALLAGDRPDSARLMTRLKELRSLEGVATCSVTVHLLAHISLPEEQAESLLDELLAHREKVTRELGRDPGLRVAAIDFLSNVRKLLSNPTIVELAELERTERSAVTDALTDLYNRRYFQDALEVELRRSQRHALALSLLMLDLDAFKPVNDLYGHPFGDLVLMRTGQVIRRAVRESDVPCRVGGEEFGIILPETDRLGAYYVAERVRRRIQESFLETPIQSRAVTMTISGGVAAYPDDGEDSSSLISLADRALYRAKALGRNRVAIYHAERRLSVRFPVASASRIQMGPAAGDSGHEAAGVNLSHSGLLLRTEDDYLPADSVRLELIREPHRWEIVGRVVRVERDAAGAHRNLVAVAFNDVLPAGCLSRNVDRRTVVRRGERGTA
jgi:diguanylate cyclase (GGDEF)-like protein